MATCKDFVQFKPENQYSISGIEKGEFICIDWSWWWVVSPIWIYFGVVIIITIIILLISK